MRIVGSGPAGSDSIGKTAAAPGRRMGEAGAEENAGGAALPRDPPGEAVGRRVARRREGESDGRLGGAADVAQVGTADFSFAQRVARPDTAGDEHDRRVSAEIEG